LVSFHYRIAARFRSVIYDWISSIQNHTRSSGGLSLKGCQIVAGGRSVARTTGQQSKIIPHPGRV
jgi:hypothetical protein